MTDVQCTVVTLNSKQISDGRYWVQMTVVGPDRIFGVLNFWCEIRELCVAAHLCALIRISHITDTTESMQESSVFQHPP